MSRRKGSGWWCPGPKIARQNWQGWVSTPSPANTAVGLWTAGLSLFCHKSGMALFCHVYTPLRAGLCSNSTLQIAVGAKVTLASSMFTIRKPRQPFLLMSLDWSISRTGNTSKWVLYRVGNPQGSTMHLHFLGLPRLRSVLLCWLKIKNGFFQLENEGFLINKGHFSIVPHKTTHHW